MPLWDVVGQRPGLSGDEVADDFGIGLGRAVEIAALFSLFPHFEVINLIPMESFSHRRLIFFIAISLLTGAASQRIGIIGAGIGGSYAAYELAKGMPEAEIILFEKEEIITKNPFYANCFLSNYIFRYEIRIWNVFSSHLIYILFM